MNEKIQWSDDYLVGIDEIDQQHKTAINAVNKLYEAIDHSENKNEIIALIKQLDFYVKIHFETEEKYMDKFNYEDELEHKEAHKYFKDTYEQIRYNYYYIDDRDLPKLELLNIYAIHLCQTLLNWLSFHLEVFDKKFANFIKEKNL